MTEPIQVHHQTKSHLKKVILTKKPVIQAQLTVEINQIVNHRYVNCSALGTYLDACGGIFNLHTGAEFPFEGKWISLFSPNETKIATLDFDSGDLDSIAHYYGGPAQKQDIKDEECEYPISEDKESLIIIRIYQISPLKFVRRYLLPNYQGKHKNKTMAKYLLNISSQNEFIVFGKYLYFINWETSKIRTKIAYPTEYVTNMALDPTESRIAILSENNVADIITIADGHIETISYEEISCGLEEGAHSIGWSSTGQFLMMADESYIAIFEGTTLQPIQTLFHQKYGDYHDQVLWITEDKLCVDVLGWLPYKCGVLDIHTARLSPIDFPFEIHPERFDWFVICAKFSLLIIYDKVKTWIFKYNIKNKLKQ